MKNLFLELEELLDMQQPNFMAEFKETEKETQIHSVIS